MESWIVFCICLRRHVRIFRWIVVISPSSSLLLLFSSLFLRVSHELDGEITSTMSHIRERDNLTPFRWRHSIVRLHVLSQFAIGQLSARHSQRLIDKGRKKYEKCGLRWHMCRCRVQKICCSVPEMNQRRKNEKERKFDKNKNHSEVIAAIWEPAIDSVIGGWVPMYP